MAKGSSGFDKGGKSTARGFKNAGDAMVALYHSSQDKKDGMISRWTNYGKDRLYVNMEKLYNMKVEMYKTGNIAYASVDGEKISNSKAGKILAEKVYIDTKTGQVRSGNNRFVMDETKDRLSEYIPKRIKKFIKF